MTKLKLLLFHIYNIYFKSILWWYLVRVLIMSQFAFLNILWILNGYFLIFWTFNLTHYLKECWFCYKGITHWKLLSNHFNIISTFLTSRSRASTKSHSCSSSILTRASSWASLKLSGAGRPAWKAALALFRTSKHAEGPVFRNGSPVLVL